MGKLTNLRHCLDMIPRYGPPEKKPAALWITVRLDGSPTQHAIIPECEQGEDEARLELTQYQVKSRIPDDATLSKSTLKRIACRL